jgi:23S rRNA (cytidine1920-2'-O)/16S rRNA (cytidine1409-2'-O)-methyltransferase
VTNRMRADLLLVQRGVFDSRAKAQASIAAGLVSADGVVLKKASVEISLEAEITAEAAHPYVSRGGVKLAAALDHFGIDPKGLNCLDVGSSTGGFTDVLLKRGAARVTCVDTGSGQLHPGLRSDARVKVFESTNIISFEQDGADRDFDLAVIDVSFVSLTKILPAVRRLVLPKASIVALIKPQFEAGREHIGKGGIVKDEGIQMACVETVRAVLAGMTFPLIGVIPSPIAGGDGNREFLIAARQA